MITRCPAPWQVELSKGFRDPRKMLATLGLDRDPSGLPFQLTRPIGEQTSNAGATSFPLLAPRGYVARMEKGNPQDPLLRQVLPSAAESIISPGYTQDPLEERHALRASGVLQKYSGRVLLMVTSACAIHCRYCFRRHFPQGNQTANKDPHGQTKRDFHPALACIRKDRSIREVILSGGDPLCLPDERLAALTTELANIPHVKRLRIHTRLPVVLPARVNDTLLDWLAKPTPHRVLVIHANHPNEIDHEVTKALALLRMAGVTLLNQSVLLRGVNDHEDTLTTLSECLFAAGVLPYYLHMLDPVQGAAHFAVEERRAKEIVTGLRTRLPGYLVPRLVREIAGAGYKIPV